MKRPCRPARRSVYPPRIETTAASWELTGAEHVAVAALLLPVALFGFGLACAWILRGLRADTPCMICETRQGRSYVLARSCDSMREPSF
jgi:hypothetical protein